MSSFFGIAEKQTCEKSATVWQERILQYIKPEDFHVKKLLEIQLYQYIKNEPIEDRLNYYGVLYVNLKTERGEYIPVELKMYYASSKESVQLVLYVYSFTSEINTSAHRSAVILNSHNGNNLRLSDFQNVQILTKREIEVLKEIMKGKASKEIAGELHISKNTIDRHQQNIITKLNAKNSSEACNTALLLGVI